MLMQARSPMPLRPRCVVNRNPTKPAMVVVELAITLRPVVSISWRSVMFLSLIQEVIMWMVASMPIPSAIGITITL